MSSDSAIAVTLLPTPGSEPITPGLMHVLSPKIISAKARPLGKTENKSGRLILFFLIGAVFWVF
ncbi:MAG TPA: hypothetical protein VJ865_08310, partial [Gemmatimonadaceae bacterium]|nr:hypothetical protein [Gemmatimonadaceae bacterium]